MVVKITLLLLKQTLIRKTVFLGLVTNTQKKQYLKILK